MNRDSMMLNALEDIAILTNHRPTLESDIQLSTRISKIDIIVNSALKKLELSNKGAL